MEIESKLALISQRAKSNPKEKFNNLIHLINPTSLRESYKELKRGKAPGVDGICLKEYREKLEENIENLFQRMKTMSYCPQPVRRAYIPKSKDKRRPLGIPATEDKIVQKVFTEILSAIYEVDFLDNSYGYRPRRNCHQALARIDSYITGKPVNYVIDADIKGFFDNVKHEILMKLLGERISDRKFLRYIGRFLRSGIMEEGKYFATEMGTPQGGIISPILANIYLHYAIDRWIENRVKTHLRGYVELVRYADDFVILLENKAEAVRLLETLGKRLSKYGLELSMEKTRLIQFGKKVRLDKEKKPPDRNDNSRDIESGTFDFLGFTHYMSQTRQGRFKVGRKTAKDRFAGGLKNVAKYLKENRNRVKLDVLWRRVSQRLIGHYQYYGVSDNSKKVAEFRYRVVRLLFKWLNRRSQRRSKNWAKFGAYEKMFPLPRARIYVNLYSLEF